MTLVTLRQRRKSSSTCRRCCSSAPPRRCRRLALAKAEAQLLLAKTKYITSIDLRQLRSDYVAGFKYLYKKPGTSTWEDVPGAPTNWTSGVTCDNENYEGQQQWSSCSKNVFELATPLAADGIRLYSTATQHGNWMRAMQFYVKGCNEMLRTQGGLFSDWRM